MYARVIFQSYLFFLLFWLIFADVSCCRHWIFWVNFLGYGGRGRVRDGGGGGCEDSCRCNHVKGIFGLFFWRLLAHAALPCGEDLRKVELRWNPGFSLKSVINFCYSHCCSLGLTRISVFMDALNCFCTISLPSVSSCTNSQHVFTEKLL